MHNQHTKIVLLRFVFHAAQLNCQLRLVQNTRFFLKLHLNYILLDNLVILFELFIAMELEEPININELFSRPLVFRIDRSNEIDDINESDDGVERDPSDLEKNNSPWKHSFVELKQTMTKLPNCEIYKRLVDKGSGDPMGRRRCRFKWSYSQFFEFEDTSFDSSFTSGVKVRTNMCDEVFKGIFLAIETMRKGEESHFIIDSKLMFGKHGMVIGDTIIKPNADILLVAKLIDFDEVGAEDACDSLTEDELRRFCNIKKNVAQMLQSANDKMRTGSYKASIRVCLNVVSHLKFCEIGSVDEKRSMEQLMADAMAKLIKCYVKEEKYKKADAFVKELRLFSNVDQNVNVLIYEAIALSKIGDDFKRPIELLRNAQRIEPHNELVNKTLSGIFEAKAKYDNDAQEFKNRMKRAFQLKEQPKAGQPGAEAPKNDEQAAKETDEMVESLDKVQI